MLAVIKMEKYRNPILVKAIIFFTVVTFFIASLSPDFMSSMLGFTNMEPFVIAAYQYCFTVGPPELILNPEYESRKIGIFAIFMLLMVILVFYLLYLFVKKVHGHYKTANKAIKKDV